MWVGPPGTEATLVFRGVTLNDGSYTAYIEDMTGGGIRRFSRGEHIAAGRIASITLNGIDYDSGKKVTRVVLGQNFAGGDAPPPAPPAAAPHVFADPPEAQLRVARVVVGRPAPAAGYRPAGRAQDLARAPVEPQ